MKKFNKISVTAAVLLMLFAVQAAIAVPSPERRKGNPQDVLTIRGKVIDKDTRAPLVFASVVVKETNVATVTNIDGEFLIKVTDLAASKNLEFVFLGYKNKTLPLSDMRDNGYKNVIELESAPIPIQEIVVKPIMPDDIVQKMVAEIGKNYATVPNLMTAFYRETIRKNRTYVSIGEALVEIFKAPYSNALRFDGTRIYKGRKNVDTEKVDTLLFKLQGGPVTSLQLDIVKNPEQILTQESMKYYDYKLTGVVEIDGRPNYVVEFLQKPSVEIPLFMGKLFIDTKTFALAQAEFGFNLSNKEEATSLFIKKKPLGVEVTPDVATYLVKYRMQDTKWYFTYSRAEVKFKVNWKKRLFHTNFTTMSEMAVTDRTDQEVIKFANKDKMKFSDIFLEEVSAFADPQFWGDYNVIEPDQSIESAIHRLARKVKFSDRQK
ncbi:MAG TPA: carboxypeptidase-like regulatory domain-containing protein [Bacteroidales bacterium]|nr:carboxypeptidase-like regulatory domain-containing protein [Bacteroidales bacterium]